MIRHRANATTQVGIYSVITGRFLPYPHFTHTPGYTTFYRGRDEIPLYADYLYRLDHEAGVDVSRQTNLSLLLSTFTVESAAELQRADGDEQLVYLFDISQEPYLESVEVEAMLANDYRVEVANLREANIRGKGYEERFKSEFYRTVLRARDNVQDLSNLKRVRFRIGEDTAIFTYSADLNLQVVGLELNGEYARSSVYRRFPAETANLPSFDESPRFADRGSAYFINATRWTGNWRFGGEYFAMNPEFTTTMRSFVAREGGVSDHRSTIKGISNDTIYWDLVQDNEDGDRFPDKRTGWTTGTWYINDCNPPCGIDPDGVYISQDSDNDGYPDINRNGDALPDYLEPFLMYEVEPNDYTYGLDRNNNDEPDQREDDWDPDHPYDADQRGYHVFAQANLSQGWTLALGRHDVEQMAGSGMNLTTYTLLTYRREGLDRARRLFFENSFRRVRDNIPDEYNIFTENRRFTGEYRFYVHSAYRGNRSFHSRPREDQLLYENSYVNEAYLENWLQPWSTLNLVQKLRLRVNWQKGGRLSGGFIGRERRLDHSTFVNRLDYTWHLGKLSIRPKFKFQMIRFVDREQDRTIRFEYETLPILLFEMPLMARTTARLGIQGWGPLPYRFDNRQRGLDSFRRRTAIASLTNRSRYFGYELYTVVGLIRDAKEFDSAARSGGNFDTFSVFVRTLVGFPDLSNLLL